NALAREGLNAPSEVLRRLNLELIQRSGDQPRFATAFYGVIDMRDNVVTLAGAGHPPVYVYGPNGKRQYHSGGGLLGIFPEDSFDQHEFVLSEGESLVIYSDGFETAFDEEHDDNQIHQITPNEEYINQFETLTNDAASTNLDEAMIRFVQNLDQQTGSLHQTDDLTAVVISARTVAQQKIIRKVA
ncbi:MAG: PP2C family protein-serine/threonine phosphatase, partial [Planctomycetota bacterium]